jgi:type 2 lantibiotic biosynthesis protein LanM
MEPSISDQPHWPATRPEPLDEPVTNEWGFAIVAWSLIRAGRQQVRHEARRLADAYDRLPLDPETVADLLSVELCHRLGPMVGRTMVLELNVARLRGELRGETPQMRYESFLTRLCDEDYAAALLSEYPVLTRQLAQSVDQWASFNCEFLRDLAADWPALCGRFGESKASDQLAGIVGGAGDTHFGGRSVRIVRFSSGLRLVYKPRSVSLDIHFQEMLQWLNDRGAQPDFRTVRLLDRDTHGWSEFVTAECCVSEAAARRFYERQGGYLALLHALRATDFHAENLIAAGEHPVLIDLEALFHPSLDLSPEGPAETPAIDPRMDSVLATGLLPVRCWGNDESEGIDFSGLGARGGQLTPFTVPNWQGSGTDEMRLTRDRVIMDHSQNRPMLGGAEVDLLAYGEAIATGFARTYDLLLAHRDELQSETGVLARFANDHVRVIVRPTSSYATLLQESFHPDVLRDSSDRELLFDRLRVAAEGRPKLKDLIPHERDDLINNDIPIFTTTPNSPDLTSSSGKVTPDFFHQTGLQLARKRIAAFSAEDRDRQLFHIRDSLATMAGNANG